MCNAVTLEPTKDPVFVCARKVTQTHIIHMYPRRVALFSALSPSSLWLSFMRQRTVFSSSGLLMSLTRLSHRQCAMHRVNHIHQFPPKMHTSYSQATLCACPCLHQASCSRLNDKQ